MRTGSLSFRSIGPFGPFQLGGAGATLQLFGRRFPQGSGYRVARLDSQDMIDKIEVDLKDTRTKRNR